MNMKEVIDLLSNLPKGTMHLEQEFSAAMSNEHQLYLSAVLMQQGFSVKCETISFKTYLQAVRHG